MENKHYFKDCGCMYTEGRIEPWYICPTHFSDNKREGNKLPMKHYWLYALKLENDKYYIGITTRSDPQRRIFEHRKGSFLGARWTRLHKPLETLEIRNLGTTDQESAERIEQELTLEYMKKYGLQNVRGGSLTYPKKYIRLGNRYWEDEVWMEMIVIVVLLFAIAVLVVSKILG